MMPFLMLLGFVLAAGVAAAVWTATGDIFLAGGLAGGSVVVLGLAWSTVRAAGEAARRRRAASAVPSSLLLQKTEVTGSSDAHMASPTIMPSSITSIMHANQKPISAALIASDMVPKNGAKLEEETKSNVHAQAPVVPRVEAPAPAQAPQPAPAEPTAPLQAPQPPQSPPAEAPTPEPPQSPTDPSPPAEQGTPYQKALEKRTPNTIDSAEKLRWTYLTKPKNRLFLKLIADNPGITVKEIKQKTGYTYAHIVNFAEDMLNLGLIRKEQEITHKNTSYGKPNLVCRSNHYHLAEGVTLD
jgi:hypothetical protein